MNPDPDETEGADPEPTPEEMERMLARAEGKTEDAPDQG